MASIPDKPSIFDPGPWRRAALVGAIAFFAGVLIHLLILKQFPNSADEYAYLWQAEAFSEGHITAQIPQPRESFAFFHLGDVDGHRFSRFPPGFSLLLTLGVWLGLPGWLNPLLAGLALAGIYRLGCVWVGEREALLGISLTGVSAFFLLNAASFFSHPSSLFALTCLALTLTVGLERPGPLPWLLAGASFGLAVLIRPYTALLIGVPQLMYFIWIQRRAFSPLRAMLLLTTGGLPFALCFCGINKAITGDYLLLATRFLDPNEGIGLGVHGHTLQQGLQNTLLWCVEALAYTFFLSPFLLVPARGRCGPHERLLWLLLIAPIVGYFFYWNPGGNRYGPRFYFEALLPFTLLCGVGLNEIIKRPKLRWVAGCTAVIGLAMVFKLMIDRHEQVEKRQIVFRTVEQANLDQAIVILLGSSADMHVFDLTRNPPDFQNAPVLYARGRGPEDQQLAHSFPNRRLYYYRWDEMGGRLWPADLANPETPDPIPDQ